MDEVEVPSFEFTDDEIANIKASLGVPIESESDVDTTPSEPQQKRRGRPKGSKNKPKISVDGDSFPPAPLTRREEREVASRLTNILMGATGMTGLIKPYLPMTEEEAKAIAEPLASYLIRNEPTNGIAREILENYDLLAMVLGVSSYSMRVYGDRKSEVQSRRPSKPTTLERISNSQASDNGRGPDEGVSTVVSVADVSRSGANPFDI